VGGQRGCLFIATEVDPHIAPLVLAWQFREVTAWLTLNSASGGTERRAARAAEDAQRFIEARAKK
jgi:hypothetical protein